MNELRKKFNALETGAQVLMLIVGAVLLFSAGLGLGKILARML